MGDLLLQRGVINQQQLKMALREQKRSGELLGDILVRLGFASRSAVSEVLAGQIGAKRIDLRTISIPRKMAEVLPEKFCRDHKVLPLSVAGNTIAVAMVDPFDVVTVDAISDITGKLIEVKAADEDELLISIDILFGESREAELSIESSIRDALGSIEGIKEDADAELEAPIIRLVNQLILRAVKSGATDIHLEPEEKTFRVRYRQDGILMQGPSIPKQLQPAVTSRIKIMASMNIAETRLPQDGRIDFKFGNREIDLRVATYPTVFGEDIVIRVLDKEKLALGLENLGFDQENLATFRELIKKPNGIILVTGPTGSGKTTTLYSTLLEINSIELNVVTLEDPVEYNLPLIRQAQVNPKAGLTFPVGLRAIFRQDPDVILVGEIRDSETAEMAIRAALTGHLVFSTLHTNDAAGSISRLLDMGVAPYLLTSSLIASMAQRLVRRICPKCKDVAHPPAELLAELQIPGELHGATFYKGNGCDDCNKTGYRGRIGIFELLVLNKKLNEMIMSACSTQDIRIEARREGMKTMREDGVKKALAGITTLEEVLRVTAE